MLCGVVARLYPQAQSLEPNCSGIGLSLDFWSKWIPELRALIAIVALAGSDIARMLTRTCVH
jgi:hypothetical protein